MKVQRILLCLACLPLCSSNPGPQRGENELRARFEALDDKRDEGGIVKLWTENPGETLGVIDSYLEGSLARLEQDPKTDPAVISAMEARALRGARAADRAFGTAIFTDYAAAFASWNAEEQKRFRRGQALFKDASKSLRAGALKEGLEQARSSLELARPLGDWWGSAMALGAMARAEATLREHSAALEHAAAARMIDHDLRLLRSEAEDLFTAVTAADGAESHERALAYAQSGLALAKLVNDPDRQAQFLGQVLRAQEKLGDKAGVEETRKEVDKLPPKAGGK